jgi:hypothetical protein
VVRTTDCSDCAALDHEAHRAPYRRKRSRSGFE